MYDEHLRKVDELKARLGKFNLSEFVRWTIDNKTEEYLKQKNED